MEGMSKTTSCRLGAFVSGVLKELVTYLPVSVFPSFLWIFFFFFVGGGRFVFLFKYWTSWETSVSQNDK